MEDKDTVSNTIIINSSSKASKESFLVADSESLEAPSPFLTISAPLMATAGYINNPSQKSQGILASSFWHGYTSENIDILSKKTLFDLNVQSTDAFNKNAEMQQEIANLKSTIWQMTDEANKQKKQKSELEAQNEVMKGKIDELQKKERVQNLLPRIHPLAADKLLLDESFREEFKLHQQIKSVIISIDIRDSTQLMLLANTPESFANFISSLCKSFSQIIKEEFGIYDKFTGDGVLAYFPDFFTGEDALLFALRAAQRAHYAFREQYRQHRSSFSVVRKDAGIGVGIDFGTTTLTLIENDYSIVGNPVVHACRLSGAEAGETLINQNALTELQRLGKAFISEEKAVTSKSWGDMIGYNVSLDWKNIDLKLPKWFPK
jgi:class 3 adenylate cyclase